MHLTKSLLFATSVVCCHCSPDHQSADVIALAPPVELPRIEGKASGLHTPFVAAGNRVYMIGNQDGSFSDIGWHIAGEMGGVWDHPIKLLDGFTASLQSDDALKYCLDSAIAFVNYPIGNEHLFRWKDESIDVERFQFVPDDIEGMIVQYKLINNNDKAKRITLCITAKSDLRPTWLADSLHVVDGKDEVRYDAASSALIFKDHDNPWHAWVGSDRHGAQPENSSCPAMHAEDNGVAGTLCFEADLEAGGEYIIPLYISGSSESDDTARKNFQLLRSRSIRLLQEKAERYKAIAERSSIDIPDKGIASMYTWLKFNTDWMVRNVPPFGVGLSAGLPDYPWWFGADATYALQGVLATGDHELVKSTIQLLNNISKRTNQDGRIVHEVSTNGVVYNRGNVNETAQFITLVYNYYQWTGDLNFVKEIFPDLQKGMEWLLITKDPDGNGFPNGSGMMEIPGLESDLEMIDVVVYTQQALKSAAALAAALDESGAAARYRSLAHVLEEKINTQWWMSGQHSFGDFRSSYVEGMEILNAALIRSDTMKKTESVRDLKRLQQAGKPSAEEATFLIYRNWVVNTPMETGVASAMHALPALQSAGNYQNAYGTFVTGIDKTDEPDSVVLASRKKIFSYTGAVMTLPTGVVAVGAARYGQMDLALENIKKLERSFSYALPGSMYEVSPDFGMITQAWNIYGVAIPIVTGIFGIVPDAGNKTITINPILPSSWNNASIQHVRVGENVISVSLRREGKNVVCDVSQLEPGWTIAVKADALAESSNTGKYSGNGFDAGKVVDGFIRQTGKNISLRFSR